VGVETPLAGPVSKTDPRSARLPAMSESPNPEAEALRDLSEVPAVEVVLTVAVHLMSAAAVACGLAEEEGGETPPVDLAEARILITALAGLVNASAPLIGSVHAAPLRDGLSSLQAAFREASAIPDADGQGPGES
jgi:hypothetical protein